MLALGHRVCTVARAQRLRSDDLDVWPLLLSGCEKDVKMLACTHLDCDTYSTDQAAAPNRADDGIHMFDLTSSSQIRSWTRALRTHLLENLQSNCSLSSNDVWMIVGREEDTVADLLIKIGHGDEDNQSKAENMERYTEERKRDK